MFLYSIVIELVTGQTHYSSTSKSHPASIFSRLADSYRVGPSIKKMRRTGLAQGDAEDADKTSGKVDVMKDARLGRINIEWVDMNPGEESELGAVRAVSDSGGLTGPSALDESRSGSALMAIESVPVPFTWGRSQLNAGIVHLYRDRKELDTSLDTATLNNGANKHTAHPNKDSPSDTSVRTNPISSEQTLNVLCLLAVPAYMTAQDVLLFTAPFAASIQHVRFIRDAVHSRSMVLLNFRTGAAFEGEPAAFYAEYSGKLFNSLDEAVCTVVYVRSVEFKSHAIPYFDMNQPVSAHTGMIRSPKNAISPTNGSSSSLSASASSSSSASPKLSIVAQEKSPLETSAMIELPTCPVCLDRMDSSVTGLVTILCHHSFHCNCLSKWQDASCPVCRYTSGGTQQFQLGANFHSRAAHIPIPTSTTATSNNTCSRCPATSNLWICLVCGTVGCGRYESAHAANHYTSNPSHVYALELETQRVWDYVGDGYVHRLIRTGSDGRGIVELTAPAAAAAGEYAGRGRHGGVDSEFSVSDESEEALGLEYSLLLSHQLESQRHWFEEQMAAQAAANASLMEALRQEFQESMQVRVEAAHVEAAKQCQLGFNEEQKVWMRDRERLEKKLDKTLDRMQLVERQFQEEREINDGLRENQDALKLQLARREAEILEKGKQVEELNEQVRDLMFYLEAQQKVDASPLKNELQNGTVVLEQQQEPSAVGTSSKSKGKKKRK
ncbi:BRCA1-associated protein 2-domain-containing protein [Chytriomyces cf. hyalinus JEL632]|nr:BRCA1-associated protein 2-domain-containing protein [Chytriomyces cf. hyalinus JEL632]